MIEWFRHDTDARNDIKIRKLLRDNDRAALGAYWMCIEIIYQNEGYADEAAVTEELSFYNMDEFIPAMLALDLIERAEGGKLTSKRVLSEIETNKKMAEVRSEKARKAINTRWHKNGVESNGIQTNTDEYERIRTDTKHTTQHNTTQQNKYRSVSKDTSLGEHCECPPVEEAEKTDLFGRKIEEERERAPLQKIVDYWNKSVKDTALPQIKQPNESRKTLIRQRWSPIIWLLANNTDKESPFFYEFEIADYVKEMKKGDKKEFKTEKGTPCYIEWFNPDITELQKKNRKTLNELFFGFKNPRLGSITNEDWQVTPRQHIPKANRPEDVVPLLRNLYIYYNGKYVRLDIVKHVDLGICCYAHWATKTYTDSVILTTEDRYDNRYLYGFGQGKVHKLLTKLFGENRVYYATNDIGTFIDNYMLEVKAR